MYSEMNTFEANFQQRANQKAPVNGFKTLTVRPGFNPFKPRNFSNE